MSDDGLRSPVAKRRVISLCIYIVLSQAYNFFGATQKSMPNDLAIMDQLLRSDPKFVDYVAAKAKESDVRALEARVQALLRAKAQIESTAVTRPSRRQYKNAKTWCTLQNWKEEDAKEIVAEYRRQLPTSQTVSKKTRTIADGLRNIGSAIIM